MLQPSDKCEFESQFSQAPRTRHLLIGDAPPAANGSATHYDLPHACRGKTAQQAARSRRCRTRLRDEAPVWVPLAELEIMMQRISSNQLEVGMYVCDTWRCKYV